MSFILDALKKSEADRQRQNSPDMMRVPTESDRSSSSRWFLIVGILLLVNVVVLSVVFFRPDATDIETTPAAAQNEPASPDAATTDGAESFRDLVTNARREQTDLSPPPPVETRQETRLDETPAVATPTPAAAQVSSVATNYGAAPPGTSPDVFKTFNQVRIEGSVRLPDLHLDIHVYSDDADDRFVFINMNKYKELETLSEGPTVSEIVPEGVILEYSGTRFLLPRQ